MTADNALRYLAYRAAECRDRDTHEALCLLFPALMEVLGLATMGDCEARAFHHELKESLRNPENKRGRESASQRPQGNYTNETIPNHG